MKNPPAFPSPEHWNTGGMTLRDYFAAAIAAGIAANHGISLTVDTYIAENAYQIADAMLAAREKKEGK